jgi:phasin family protein
MTDQKTDTAPKTEAPRAEAPAAQAVRAAAPAAAKAAEAPAKAAPVAARTARAAKPAKASRGRKARKTPTRAVRAQAAAKAATTRNVRKTAETVEKTMKKGSQTMKNETNQVADRIQAVFGDVNERARTAIERNTRVAEEMTDLAKGNVEAIVASTKIAAKGVEKIGQEVADYSRKSFEDASAAIRGFAEIKSPTDLFRLQGEFARTQFDSVVAESSKLSETMIKLAGDMFEPITSRYSVAAERVKNAVAL